MIREYVGHLHDQGLQKSSIARKLAALRSFFKYCVREGLLKESPARLVPTPKLPKRVPSVLSAEEMNGFLNQLAEMAAVEPSAVKSAGAVRKRALPGSQGEPRPNRGKPRKTHRFHPGQRENKLRLPVHHPRLEHERADPEQNAGRDVLREIARPPIDLRAYREGCSRSHGWPGRRVE